MNLKKGVIGTQKPSDEYADFRKADCKGRDTCMEWGNRVRDMNKEGGYWLIKAEKSNTSKNCHGCPQGGFSRIFMGSVVLLMLCL